MISSIGRVNDVTITVAVGVMTAVASGWLVFFLNGRLQARADFRPQRRVILTHARSEDEGIRGPQLDQVRPDVVADPPRVNVKR